MDFNDMVAEFETEEKRQQAKATADRIRAYGGTNQAVLDFGCGPGLLGMELLDDCTTMTFVDSSEGMISRVQEKIGDEPKARAFCCDLGIDPHCLDEYSFDLIVSSLALHHVPHLEAVLAKFSELLNSGGQIVVVEMDKEDVVHQGNATHGKDGGAHHGHEGHGKDDVPHHGHEGHGGNRDSHGHSGHPMSKGHQGQGDHKKSHGFDRDEFRKLLSDAGLRAIKIEDFGAGVRIRHGEEFPFNQFIARAVKP